MKLSEFLIKRKIICSMAEGRRIINHPLGVICVNGKPETDLNRELEKGDMVQIGTRSTETPVTEKELNDEQS